MTTRQLGHRINFTTCGHPDYWDEKRKSVLAGVDPCHEFRVSELSAVRRFELTTLTLAGHRSNQGLSR